jgi:CheY-like chemotaxis protein
MGTVGPDAGPRIVPRASSIIDINVTRQSLCILLVEDDADSLSALARLLKMSGHHTLMAGTAAEALRLVRSQRCDVVVSDVGLPDRSGLDLMRAIAVEQTIPAVAVSGYTDPADVRECERAGFARHIKKPIDFQELLDVVEELCRSRGRGGHGGARPSAS